MNQDKKTHIENDLIGDMEVPDDVLYGVQTLRALENFDISLVKLNHYPRYVEAMAITKEAAAIANHREGLLPDDIFKAIVEACEEIRRGKHHEFFIVDMVQGGAGTSTNMNANEVITNRALEILGKPHGSYKVISPNDHTNLSQSTNDAYPTFIHLGLYQTYLDLLPGLNKLIDAFKEKAVEFKDILKTGRTQMQDAVPMTMGQTFNGFATILEEELPNLKHAAEQLLTVNMGATAIGTGICSEPSYRAFVLEALRDLTGWNIELARDMVGATSDTSHMIGFSQAMKRLAVKLSKISNDLRLLSSGPRAGIGEINLPARQPGSSIMPGKVNPVIPEVVTQVAMKIIGNDVCVTMAGEAAQLELNAMEPIMAQCCFESADFLISVMDIFRKYCIEGITANAEHATELAYKSMSIVTALNPYIGYKNSTKIAKEAMETGKSIPEIVFKHGILSQEQLDTILAPENLLVPVHLDIKPLKNMDE